MSDNNIKHTGILGMKWGHRKGESSRVGGTGPGGNYKEGEIISKSDTKWIHGTMKNSAKIYNAAADRMNATEIKRINNKPEYRGKNLLKDPALNQKYLKDYADTLKRVATQEANRISGPSPSRQLTIVAHTFPENPGAIRFSINAIKHAANTDPYFVGELDENGFIVSIRLEGLLEEAIQAIQHAGVMGMKWGVRRGEKGGENWRFTKTTKDDKTPGSKTAKKTQAGETSGKVLKKKIAKPTSEDFKAVAELRKKHINEMSNEEISKITKRMDLERRYKDLNPTKVAKGKKTVNGIFSTIGKVTAATASIGALVTIGSALMKRVGGIKSVQGALKAAGQG